MGKKSMTLFHKPNIIINMEVGVFFGGGKGGGRKIFTFQRNKIITSSLSRS